MTLIRTMDYMIKDGVSSKRRSPFDGLGKGVWKMEGLSDGCEGSVGVEQRLMKSGKSGVWSTKRRGTRGES